jgi:hypothetical protein
MRKAREYYRDFCQLSAAPDEQIFLFAPNSYIGFFNQLTSALSPQRIVFHYGSKPVVGGCRLVPYVSDNARTWHYACAMDFVEGRLKTDIA